MTVAPETLAAFADGQLSPEEAARVAALVASDPALAAEVEAHRRLRETLSAHFAPILDMPVPEALHAPFERQAEVVDIAAAKTARIQRRPSVSWMMGGAIAASLAIGFTMGWLFPGGGQIGSVNGTLVAQGALDTALTRQLSSERGSTHILLSFKSLDGRFCRGFENDGTAGIACRSDDRWVVIRTEASKPGRDSPYLQAGSAAANIMAEAQDMAAGGALDAAAERDVRAGGWKAGH